MVEPEEPKHSAGAWRKSSYSTYNGNCVEVAVFASGQVGVRDSKDRRGAGRVLTFSPADWSDFLNLVRSGEPRRG